MTTTQVREAQPNDFDGVMRLYRQLQPRDPVLTNGADKKVFQAILQNPDLYLFVLIKTDLVVATTYLNIIPNITRSASPYAVIENVVTDEALRGTGVGKQLMQYTLQFAWDEGCYKVMLQTGSKQESTHGFYRACGFSGDEKKGYLARPQRN
ncbi:MAG: GNAT family N-acetyltransferase [Pseudomonadota bacterium]